jgi:hypothetical protein
MTENEAEAEVLVLGHYRISAVSIHHPSFNLLSAPTISPFLLFFFEKLKDYYIDLRDLLSQLSTLVMMYLQQISVPHAG